MKGARLARCALIAVPLCWWAWMPVASAAPYELVAVSSLDQSALSPLGKFFLGRAPSVVALQTDHFIVIASSHENAKAMAREAEAGYDGIRRVFPAETYEPKPAWLVLVDDPVIWQDMIRQHRLREDGLALQIERELYFNHSSAKRPDRIFHEIVHLRLREVFPGRDLPLWLEEGLASHYGWMHTEDFQQADGFTITRTFPVVRAEELFELPALLETADYPPDPSRAKIFYRQAEVLVSLLAEKLGRDGMAGFTATMIEPHEGETAYALFRRASGLDEAKERAIVVAMQTRIVEELNP